MATYYIFDKSYRTGSANIAARRAVVRATTATNTVTMPTGPNAGAIAGITMHTQNDAGRAVSVRKAGIAEVVAANAIAIGAPVMIADTNGRVKAVSETAGTKVEIVGYAETAATAAGDVIEILVAPHQRTA